MQRNLDVTTSGVANLGLSSRTVHQAQQTKDRLFQVQSFSNKAAQFHAPDLFNVQLCMLDLAETAKGLASYLALNVCSTPPDNASEAGDSARLVPPFATINEDREASLSCGQSCSLAAVCWYVHCGV